MVIAAELVEQLADRSLCFREIDCTVVIRIEYLAPRPCRRDAYQRGESGRYGAASDIHAQVLDVI
jgi:hypothetical protein